MFFIIKNLYTEAPTSVSFLIHKNNTSEVVRLARAPDEIKAKARELYESGIMLKDIAGRLDVPEGTDEGVRT